MIVSKENIFDLIKSSVLILRDKYGELITHGKLRQKWNKERIIIEKSIDKLSQDDLEWLKDKYSAWAKDNLTNPKKNNIKGIK